MAMHLTLSLSRDLCLSLSRSHEYVQRTQTRWISQPDPWYRYTLRTWHGHVQHNPSLELLRAYCIVTNIKYQSNPSRKLPVSYQSHVFMSSTVWICVLTLCALLLWVLKVHCDVYITIPCPIPIVLTNSYGVASYLIEMRRARVISSSSTQLTSSDNFGAKSVLMLCYPYRQNILRHLYHVRNRNTNYIYVVQN